MEGRKLNLYAPLPSIRRIPSFIERSSELGNTKTKITRPVLRSCPSTKQETPVFVLPDQSFYHLTESASVPFVWEQSPGKPKDDMATLIQESGLLETDEDEEDDEDEDEDLDTVPSNGSFSVNCSTSGVSEIEKNGEKSDGDDEKKSRESLDLMMSRFLPAAKAMACQIHQKHQSSYNSSEQKQITQTKEALVIRQRSQLVSEHEHFAIVQSLYDDLNIDDDDDDEDDDDDDDDDDDYGDDDHKICPNVTKKACGFLPRLCAKNSFKFLNPVPLDSVSSNRSMKHSSGEQTGLPNWSTRRLSGFISPYRTSCSDSGFLGTPEKPTESFKRLNRGISKSQELYPTRTRREIHPNYSNSGEIRTFRNSVSTPSRNQRTTIPDSRFLVEEVNRRRINNRSGNLLKSSPDYTPEISPPPLPETPSRSWLRRTLLPPVNPRPYGVVLSQVGNKKLDQEVLESTKWETIVKTSYVHNDHARYSQELIVHPSSRQQNT
ncbi:PREDICTED: uncharacterized protein LOC104731713 [Camelina sativa]|uniref:Uncharacterized protein LOC104731713 n=1 Tax=Camelina sativa TaxID=90675 RepID=A0ABM0V1N8_CAMSA|nr:PREDICTED: uncharacterized protein LOC104731713 [Camelina sativa]XP_010449489.1 PREDICTED: uncharacterized protein LOC104731713 [Camelina sativa]